MRMYVLVRLCIKIYLIVCMYVLMHQIYVRMQTMMGPREHHICPPRSYMYSCKLKLIDHQPHRLLREEARVRAAFGAGPVALVAASVLAAASALQRRC